MWCVLLLTGCATTTTVDQHQAGYQMPSLYTVTVAHVSLDAVRRVCDAPLALGCSYWATDRQALVWLSEDQYAEHEFRHLIYGPRHIEDRQ